jgi:hypothetical protein
MAVLLPGKFIFLATPHTGSMAVAYALKKLPGAINVQDKAWGVGHHATLDQVKETVPEKIQGSERVFAFVRNPYDLLATWYVREQGRSRLKALGRELRRRPTMADFIRAWAQHRPAVYFKDGRMFYHAAEAHQVLRYERGIEREVNSFLRKLVGMPTVQIRVENETPGKDHWSLYYDAEAYKAANEAFGADFADHGYPFLWG